MHSGTHFSNLIASECTLSGNYDIGQSESMKMLAFKKVLGSRMTPLHQMNFQHKMIPMVLQKRRKDAKI
jgi:hypothetical protein